MAFGILSEMLLWEHIHACISQIMNYLCMRCIHVLHSHTQIVGSFFWTGHHGKVAGKVPRGFKLQLYQSCLVCTVFTPRQLHKPYSHMLMYCMSRLLALILNSPLSFGRHDLEIGACRSLPAFIRSSQGPLRYILYPRAAFILLHCSSFSAISLLFSAA